uniref:Loganate O-methyltransferase n=1 Tax=Macrostomum lignano TaxID=282301 RepID=A0A1I8JD48_9PLAT
MQADYNKSSRNQASSLQRFKPFIDAAVAAHTSDLTESRGPFGIADFGCSTGLNSSDAVSHLIREVRAKYASSQSCSSVLVVLNDMPHNQWSVLFDFLNGDQRSFLKQLPGVFAVTSGFSFYEQALPPSSLQIGISNICLHWCSQLPTKLSNHGFASFGTEEEQEAFRQQAARDWGSFLEARSKELVRGGVLAVNMVMAGPASDLLTDAIYQAARVLLNRGVIDSEELANFNIPMCFRTVGDLKEPSQYKRLGLELLRADALPQSDTVYYEDFLQHGDSDRSGAGLETYFQSSLTPERSDKDRETVSQQMWGELQTLAASDPERLRYSFNSVSDVVRKL